MKGFISTKFYAFLNYATALILLSSPWTLGLAQVSSAALFLPLLIGWFKLIMAIFGNNELGFIKVFPKPMQNVGDVIMGSFLFCSPWVYAFADKAFWPEVLLGGLVLIMGVYTVGSPLINEHTAPLPEGGLTSVEAE